MGQIDGLHQFGHLRWDPTVHTQIALETCTQKAEEGQCDGEHAKDPCPDPIGYHARVLKVRKCVYGARWIKGGSSVQLIVWHGV